ncbi:uncharacterized protein [Gossypium hirsutum]|uniref:RNase H type-1 domain-containing protein n=2 Tax=Gossypium TaxID=3633 RepID=A0ABR0N3Z7_GOSAR|nr:uncharacterized protein LOC107958372 [Gossypium hirsutum]KAK5784575.1 hypothetical protein PVK06_039101 [Gossypium arboreum]
MSKQGASGLIVRDNDGFVLACGQSKMERVMDASVAESTTVVKAMEFALQLGYQKVIFEEDALNVIIGLQGRNKDLSCMELVISKGRSLALLFQICVFKHTKRKCNEAAHHLAKNCYFLCDAFWMEECLSFLYDTVIKDAIYA